MRRTVCLLAILPLLIGATRPIAPDAKVLAAVEAAREGELALLEQLVNIDSGTGDVEGAGRIQTILADRLQAIGAEVTRSPAEAPGLGDNLVARLEGRGRGRILIIAHIDTVYPAGTVAERPFKIEGNRATGAGVSDEKGGVAQAITALEVLKSLDETNYKSITLLVESGEEIGSPGARQLIDKLVKDADVELNMEPGDAPDVLTVWRKGSTTIKISVTGRAAHAGVDPQNGRNAAVELINQLGVIGQFPQAGDGITANLTMLQAGERNNVIPDAASAQVNVRVRTKDQLKQVRDAFEASARNPRIAETKVTISATPAFPPLPSNLPTEALAARAQAIYSPLGRAIAIGGNGGASQSALAYEGGAPTLDGLGPVGGSFHSVREYLELETLTPRLYLMVKLLMDLGAKPPQRMK